MARTPVLVPTQAEVTTTLTVFQVIRIQLNGPFGDQVLEVAEYEDKKIAETVSRAWTQMDDVKAGRQRIKLSHRGEAEGVTKQMDYGTPIAFAEEDPKDESQDEPSEETLEEQN